MMSKLLNYNTLSHFRALENQGILDKKHLAEKYSVHLKKLTFADGGEEELDLFAWHFNKDGEDFLIPMQNDDGSMKDMDSILPLRVKGNPQLVAHGGKVYRLVPSQNYTVLKYNPEKIYSFREMVDTLSGIEHSNSKAKKLFTIMSIASYLDVCHFRVSTNPGFGKDSMVDTLGLLMGDASTVENPSLAKFEREITLNQMVGLNELTKIKKADWDSIQMVLLACAAQKPSIKKRTRKFDGVGEEIDLSHLSVVMMYNDITDYDSPDKYFDSVTDKNVIDRFPAFRFWGRITYDFSKDDDTDFKRVAREGQTDLRGIIKTLLYYKENWSSEHHGYPFSVSGVSPRWQLNISRMLRYIDLYCESKEEFDEYVALLKGAMVDYQAMLSFPGLEKAVKEMLQTQFVKETWEKEWQKYIKLINKKEKFIDKVKILTDILSGKSVSVEEGLYKW